METNRKQPWPHHYFPACTCEGCQRKRSIRIREQKAIVGIEANFIERVAQDALKKAEKPQKMNYLPEHYVHQDDKT